MLRTPPPRAEVSARAGLAVIVATTTVQATATFAVLTLAAIAPAVAAALGVSASLIGFQISIAFGSAAASSLVAGALVRRWGPCRCSQVSLALVSAGATLATVPALASLVVASVVIGLGYGLTNPSASTLLIRFAPQRHRNLIFSIKQTGVPLGGMLAGLVAPSVALAFGWRFAPATVAAIAAMLSIALQTVRGSWDAHREPGRRLIANPFGGLGLVWRSPTLRWLTHTCFWFAFVQLCLVGFLVTLLVEELGFGLREAGALLSVAQVSGLGGRVVWGWLADRLRDGGFVLAALGSLMLGASVLTVLLTIDWPGAAVQAVVIALGASAIGWNGVYIAEIARLSPRDEVGAATGASLSVIFVGGLAGPSVFAVVHALIGSYTATFWLLAAGSLAGAASAAMARGAARRDA